MVRLVQRCYWLADNHHYMIQIFELSIAILYRLSLLFCIKAFCQTYNAIILRYTYVIPLKTITRIYIYRLNCNQLWNWSWRTHQELYIFIIFYQNYFQIQSLEHRFSSSLGHAPDPLARAGWVRITHYAS